MRVDHESQEITISGLRKKGQNQKAGEAHNLRATRNNVRWASIGVACWVCACVRECGLSVVAGVFVNAVGAFIVR